MKTYKELTDKDYKYLNGLRYNIANNESDLHNFYVRETVIEYKKKMIDCIDECLSDISTALDKEKNHG